MKKLLLIAALWFACAASAQAANSNIDGLPAGGAVAGANLFECEQTGVNNQCTATQILTFINAQFSGDLTVNAGGVVTLKATGPGATGPIGSATSTPIVTIDAQGRVTGLTGTPITPSISNVTGMGANVPAALLLSLSANGGLSSTIASGTAALGTSAIASGACATTVTAAATNTATTDVVLASFNGDPTAVTGYIPTTSGMLTVIPYPTLNNVNFKVCNLTSASVTPGAITLNWRVVR
jgi:hypothetical protein